jgi:hypothetical protein
MIQFNRDAAFTGSRFRARLSGERVIMSLVHAQLFRREPAIFWL